MNLKSPKITKGQKGVGLSRSKNGENGDDEMRVDHPKIYVVYDIAIDILW